MASNDSGWLFPHEKPMVKASARTPGERICFDIEIANVIDLKPGEDLDQYGPFDISVAAAATEAGEVRHWFDVDTSGKPAHHIGPAKAREVLRYLRDAQRAGSQVCAWNGLSFDLRWLGAAAGDIDLASEIALDLYDPMFQFFGARGFPIGLAAVAEGLGIEQKKLMRGDQAPIEWARGNHQLVIDYVAGDCRITSQVIARIVATRSIRWKTKKGTWSTEPMLQLRRVRDVLNDPPPDTSWMSSPMKREKFHAWLTQPK
jgi:hypothetical protein